jgi:hypothetical protein
MIQHRMQIPRLLLDDLLRSLSDDTLYRCYLESAIQEANDQFFPRTLFWDGVHYLQSERTQPNVTSSSTTVDKRLDDQPRAYRQLIVVYDTTRYARRQDVIQSVLKRTAFDVRTDSSYEDIRSFEDNVRRILSQVLEPYVTPASMSKQALERSAFTNVEYLVL